MVNAGELGNVEDEAGVGELAEFIAIKCGRIEGTAEHFETVEVSGIVLFEGANEGLHV